MTTPKLRTIPKALKYFRDRDPNTAITENWLRHQIKRGLIPCHRAGKRYLIDVDWLDHYFSNPPKIHSDNRVNSTIRQIVDR